MSIDSFFFLVKSAFRSLFRNFMLTLASVTVLAVCLVVLGSSVLIAQNVDAFIDEIGAQNEVVLFMDETMERYDIELFIASLRKIRNISSIRMETKETALAKYKESLGENAALFESVEADTFRDSVIFEIQDLSKYDQTMYEVEKLGGIGSVRAPQTVVSRILDIRDTLSFFAACIVILFLFVSIFIIMNSVKLSVFARRLEISIMKYVGATDLFIQFPYFIEGAMIGFFAGLLGIVSQIYVYSYILAPILTDLGLFTPIDVFSAMGTLAWAFLGGGILVGVVGSVIPLKKYLQV